LIRAWRCMSCQPSARRTALRASARRFPSRGRLEPSGVTGKVKEGTDHIISNGARGPGPCAPPQSWSHAPGRRPTTALRKYSPGVTPVSLRKASTNALEVW